MIIIMLKVLSAPPPPKKKVTCFKAENYNYPKMTRELEMCFDRGFFYSEDFHLPKVRILASKQPAAVAEVAAPIQKLCPLK